MRTRQSSAEYTVLSSVFGIKRGKFEYYKNEVVSKESGKSYYWVGETLLTFTVHSALPTMYYVLTDANKNVCALVSESGEVAAKYDYTPFGKLINTFNNPNSAFRNPFLFSSEYHDEETGLVYYNYRYYNPELGRWMSQDPIGERGGFNPYGMVNNNPVGKWDLLGQKACMCGPDITSIFFKYIKSIRSYLKNLPEDAIGPIDSLSTMWEIGDNIDFYYSGKKEGCGTAGCENTVFFAGKCVRNMTMNNILYGIVSHAMGISQSTASFGAGVKHFFDHKGSFEGSEQKGAYNIGYDIWDVLDGDKLPTDNELHSIIYEAEISVTRGSEELSYNSFRAAAAEFTNCKPCGKSLKFKDLGRIGIGFVMGTKAFIKE